MSSHAHFFWPAQHIPCVCCCSCAAGGLLWRKLFLCLCIPCNNLFSVVVVVCCVQPSENRNSIYNTYRRLFSPQRHANACHYAIGPRASLLTRWVHCTFKCRPVCAASSRLANGLWRIVGNYIGKPAPTIVPRRFLQLPLSATFVQTTKITAFPHHYQWAVCLQHCY